MSCCAQDANRPAFHCCSATERKILHTLETQSAAQAQAAAKAKAAINGATLADSMPLSSAQAKAR